MIFWRGGNPGERLINVAGGWSETTDRRATKATTDSIHGLSYLHSIQWGVGGLLLTLSLWATV